MELTREQLIERVDKLLAGDWKSDEEMEQLFVEIDQAVPCPFAEIQGIIFHSDDLSSEGMVERMLSYKAIRL